jgi:hypothetical protein
LWWTALTFLATWLPLVRSVMDGPSYEWATTFFSWHFGGHGLSWDYWLLIVRVAVGIVLLYAGWRNPSPRTAAALTAWQILFAADTLYYAVTDPRGFRFRGDTLGVDISLTWIAPTLAMLFAIVAIWWIREFARRPVPPRIQTETRFANVALWTVLAIVPVQWILLHRGRGTDWYDVSGVVLTMLQWLLLNLAFQSRSPIKRVVI